MANYTLIGQIVPPNDKSYPRTTDHTRIFQIMPPFDRSYPQMADLTLEMTDHTPT